MHLGDVVVRNGDILGDAVNVGARLQALAEPGGVCISGIVYDHVRRAVPLRYADLGPQAVKNIEEPIRAYLVGPAASKSELTAPVSPTFRTLPLPDKPSLAVLPFVNLAGDPEQDYLADGIAEEITMALAKIRWFFVIAGSSSFSFKGRAVDVRQVGRDLGVRYVLEGSVRRAGQRLRITGQLLEAETGAHLWADQFEGTIEDVFEFQDRITESVVGAIEPRLRVAEIERATRKRPDSLTAYDRFLRALSQFYLASRDGMAATLRLIEETIRLDPTMALPTPLGAQCHVYYMTQGWTDDLERDRAEGERLAHAALERDRDDPTVLWMAGHTLGFLTHDYETALTLFSTARSPSIRTPLRPIASAPGAAVARAFRKSRSRRSRQRCVSAPSTAIFSCSSRPSPFSYCMTPDSTRRQFSGGRGLFAGAATMDGRLSPPLGCTCSSG